MLVIELYNFSPSTGICLDEDDSTPNTLVHTDICEKLNHLIFIYVYVMDLAATKPNQDMRNQHEVMSKQKEPKEKLVGEVEHVAIDLRKENQRKGVWMVCQFSEIPSLSLSFTF